MRYFDVGDVLMVVVASVALAIAVALPAIGKREPMRAVRQASTALLAGSVVAIVGVTHAGYIIAPDLWQAQHSINLVPFATIRLEAGLLNRDLGLLNILGNIALFVPIGLFAVLSGRFRVRGAVCLGVLLSVLVEMAQYVVGRSSDVDDVLLNTVGVVVGAVVGAVTAGLAARRLIRHPRGVPTGR